MQPQPAGSARAVRDRSAPVGHTGAAAAGGFSVHPKVRGPLELLAECAKARRSKSLA